MIYGQKIEAKPIKPEQLPPTEQKLRLMCSNNAEGGLTEAIQELISRFKLPYTIEFTSTNEGMPVCSLKNLLSQGELFLKDFITCHEDMLRMKNDARLMANCDNEVLITGETGTGKELIAKSMIGKRDEVIKTVNCAGLPSELIESELFGHVQGAFTGANKSKAGLMFAARKGIMFLDEIGELELSVQGKLLRALQEKLIRPVGSNEEVRIECKFVCATNRNLKEMVDKGSFRRDLYARISTLELDILPLAKRMCDVIPITESLLGGKKFLEKYTVELMQGKLDLSNNVRSLQSHVIRNNVLGRVNLIG